MTTGYTFLQEDISVRTKFANQNFWLRVEKEHLKVRSTTYPRYFKTILDMHLEFKSMFNSVSGLTRK